MGSHAPKRSPGGRRRSLGTALLAIIFLAPALVPAAASAETGTVTAATTVDVQGTILLLAGQEVRPGASTTSLLPDEVRLLTAEGASVELEGDLGEGLTTGDRFDGTVTIAPEAIDRINDEVDQSSAVRAHPAEAIDGESALGSAILAATETIDEPLLVGEATVSPVTTSAAAVASAHTLTFAVVTRPAAPAATIVADSTLDTLTQRLSAYWPSQSGGQLTGVTRQGAIDRFSSASACDANAVWGEAAARLGTTTAAFATSPSRHLVVIAPGDCAGAGLGSVGPKLSGGVVWLGYKGAIAELVLAHELGHNFSLGHSNAHRCDTALVEGSGCTDVAYEDFYDIMGGGLTINGTGNAQLMALNVTHKTRLAALASADLRPVALPAEATEASTSHALSPASATSGLRGLRVSDPRTGELYLVEYRSGTGIDSGSIYSKSIFAGHAPGVRVLRIRPDNNSAVLTFPTGSSVRNLYLPQGARAAVTAGVVVEVGSVGAVAHVTIRLKASVNYAPIPVTRFAGVDRYASAVSVSRPLNPGVKVVYIAKGTDYPDALSAAPAAAAVDGPVLLTLPTVLPDSVKNELYRLKPERIVVVGGTAAVSAGVERQLRDIAPTTRIGGTDRYQASRGVVSDAFGTVGAERVYLATGANFPDALAASAAAGKLGGAVLLVQGTAARLDADTTALILRLDPVDVVIAGGPSSVSDGILADAKALGLPGGAFRIGGSDRYETSKNINKEAFADAASVYLATGANFPDALAGAARAGSVGSPLYVVPGVCVTAATLAEIRRFAPSRILILGGTQAVSPAVEALTAC